METSNQIAGNVKRTRCRAAVPAGQFRLISFDGTNQEADALFDYVSQNALPDEVTKSGL